MHIFSIGHSGQFGLELKQNLRPISQSAASTPAGNSGFRRRAAVIAESVVDASLTPKRYSTLTV